MKFLARIFIVVLFCSLIGAVALAQSDEGIKDDVKQAGKATKRATKKTAKQTQKQTKKAIHKSAKKTREGAQKLEDKSHEEPR